MKNQIETSFICQHCQSPMDDVKCTTPNQHDGQDCNFICPNCGTKAEGRRCFQEIQFHMNIKSDAVVSRHHSQPQLPPSATQSVGGVILGYALAENSLRSLMSNLPGHRDRSNLSEDVQRLEKYKANIVSKARETDSNLAEAMEVCIEQMRKAFDATHSKRNALAHGQLVYVASETMVIKSYERRIPNEKNEGWQEISHPTWGTVQLTETSLNEVLNSTRELQAKVGELRDMVEWLNALTNK